MPRGDALSHDGRTVPLAKPRPGRSLEFEFPKSPYKYLIMHSEAPASSSREATKMKTKKAMGLGSRTECPGTDRRCAVTRRSHSTTGQTPTRPIPPQKPLQVLDHALRGPSILFREATKMKTKKAMGPQAGTDRRCAATQRSLSTTTNQTPLRPWNTNSPKALTGT